MGSRQEIRITEDMGNKNGKIELTWEILDDICRTSGIERQIVKEQCQTFLLKHPSGQMNKKEFKDFIKMVLPNINLKKMEKNMFRMYDTNQDGVSPWKSFSSFSKFFQVEH